MSLGEGIVTFLSEAGLVVGDRIFPMTLPQGVDMPALTYRLVAMDPTLTHSSQQDHPTYTGRQKRKDRIQFDAYADTFDEAEALAAALASTITGFQGTWGEVEIQSVVPALELDDFEPEINKWRRISDFYVAWVAPVQGS
jgi:hypothetical protein